MIEVKQIGNIYGEDKGTGYVGNVWDKDNLCPTLTTMQGGNREPMIVIGGLQEHQTPRTDGISPSLTAAMGMGGGQTPMIVASRGRNPQNPSDRTPGNHVEQRLEPNSEGICNTLTSVQKDNLLLTPNNWKHKAGDGTKTRSRRISEIHPALQTNTGASQQTYLAETPYRIRKLTPKECFRLMDFTDEDFHRAEEVNSNTQLYKQAGNSIVKAVLMAIFKQML